MFNLILDGRLYLAPIGENPQRVLDVGTGTGIWAIDFADQHPSAQVIGTDLSPVQPTEVPPNLHFEVDDCTLEWLYTKESFDFIHARVLCGCIADWPAFYKEVLK
jgi:SAM-dependent methyltransferase